MTKRDPEVVAYDRQLRKDEEIADIEAFLNAYVRATGEVLEVADHNESPDAFALGWNNCWRRTHQDSTLTRGRPLGFNPRISR
jgi:hypothetical protein